ASSARKAYAAGIDLPEADPVSRLLVAGARLGTGTDAVSAYGDGGALREEPERGATQRGDDARVQFCAGAGCAAWISRARRRHRCKGRHERGCASDLPYV